MKCFTKTSRFSSRSSNGMFRFYSDDDPSADFQAAGLAHVNVDPDGGETRRSIG